MHLVSLVLENYRQFKQAAIDLADGVTGIIGLNGAGKSSLVEAIAWALYGNVAARTNKENIKRDSAAPEEEVSVTLRWEMQGAAYEIVRRLRGKNLTPDVKFLINGEVQAQSAKIVQQVIERTIGLDWQAFYTSFFARQKELNALSDLNSAARKELILRMLRIDAVDKAMELAKSEAKELKVTRELLAQKLAQLPERQRELEKRQSQLGLAAKAAQAQEKVCRQAEQRYQASEREYQLGKSTAGKYQKAKNELDQLNAGLMREEAILKRLGQSLAQADLAAKEHKDLAKNHSSAQAEAEKAQKQLESSMVNKKEAETKRDLFRRQYEELVKKEKSLLALGPNAKCPTCQRPLAGELEGIKKHFAREKKELKEKGTELAENIAELQKAEKAKLLALQELEKKLKDQARALELAQAQKGKREELVEQKLALEKSLAKLRPQLEKKAGAVAELDFNAEAFQAQEQGYLEARENYQRAKEEWQQARFQVSLNQKDVDQISLLIAELTQEREQAQAADQLYEDIQKLIKIFQDFRIYLISRIRPALGELASKLLAQMTQGRYAGMELDEDYEIFIEDKGLKYPLQRFSGGEIDLANLCLRLAISQYITEQYGAEMYFIVLDEVFGSQDALRKNAILEALAELTKRFRQILLITHVEDVKDVVGQAIQVIQDEEGLSHVQV